MTADPQTAELTASVVRALERLGATVERDPGVHPSGFPCVIVSTPSRALTMCMRARSRTAGRRLVVVGGADWQRLDLETTTELLRAGADEVLPWDDGPGAEAAASLLDRWSQIETELHHPRVLKRLVGRSPAWQRSLREVVEAALYSQDSVLLTGETGTGKELLAQLLHTLDPRKPKRDLIVVDCTTLSRELSGSELFGHERGAFTGALSSRDGAVGLADGGTLFLDEIGELPPELQSRLLRVLQEKAYKRVGDDSWRRSDFRLVCATNRDLAAEVGAGRFRRDLYHRVAGVTCHAPPLRDRQEDIQPLAEHFVAEACHDRSGTRISEALLSYLRARDYPGNVRQLRQLAGALVRRHVGRGPFTLGDLPHDELEQLIAAPVVGAWRNGLMESMVRAALADHARLQDIGRAAEDAAIRMAIQESGSVRAAAAKLQVSERTIQLRRAGARVDVDNESADSTVEVAAPVGAPGNGRTLPN
ncbi:MAG: sigma-54-dependent Fis family transcriptional regulator [Phycisphaerales bacterium]|nr:sigma-54-dependent Fis family transcriptional regulator [Phycisphaerales bacterium]